MTHGIKPDQSVSCTRSMSSDDFVLRLYAEGASDYTVQQCLYRFNKLLACQPFTEQTVRAFLAQLTREGKSASAVNKYIQVLKKMGRFYDYSWVDKFRKLREHNKTKIILSVQQLNDFFSARIENKNYHSEHKKYDMFWRLVAMTGARSSEIRKLTQSDIDLIGGFIYINKTKTYVGRPFPIHGELNKLLTQYVSTLKGELLFPTRYKEHEPISSASLRKNFLQRKNLLGIKTNITPHSLRHSFVTRMALDAGIPLSVVQSLVGHKKLDTTQKYIHNNIYAMIDAVKKDPILRDNLTDDEKAKLGEDALLSLYAKDKKVNKAKLHKIIAELYHLYDEND